MGARASDSPQRTRRPRGAPAQRPREAQLEALRVAFRRLFRELSRLRGRDTHLAAGELSHAQFQLLAELDDGGELSVGELAQAARMAPGTVTEMLALLAAFGHVERVRPESDRRVVLSRLTPQGRREIAAKRELWQRRFEQALAGVDAEQLHAATAVLERLARMVEDTALDEDSPSPAVRAKNARRSG